jgi:hypothetical protein
MSIGVDMFQPVTPSSSTRSRNIATEAWSTALHCSRGHHKIFQLAAEAGSAGCLGSHCATHVRRAGALQSAKDGINSQT